jgi:hypothetical protein
MINSNLLIRIICVIYSVSLNNITNSFSQTCPYMSTYCANAPLICDLNVLNNSVCYLVSYTNYVGDRCNTTCLASPDNTVHYAFTTDGSPFTITCSFSNCQNTIGYKGMMMAITTECCTGNLNLCTTKSEPLPPIATMSLNAKLTPCKIYYLTLDGANGSFCDYTLSVSGGAANVPLVLKNINNDPNNNIELNRGTCNYKFKVDPRDAACEGYYEWTLDGNPVNDNDRELSLSFPDEGDFQLCVKGYIGLPNFNCGESNITCTTVKVRQEHFIGNTRILCNELKGYKWFNQTINSSGIYNQLFNEPCRIFDSTVEFIILPKHNPGIVNYYSCSKADPYHDPVFKEYYRNCTANKTILMSKSTEIYACDSSYILNVAYADLKNTMHLTCKNGSVYMIPEITNHTDTCGVGLVMSLEYNWYEKTGNDVLFLSHDKELKISKKGNYQLHVILHYGKGTDVGVCNFYFDENIDEDIYLGTPTTGTLTGKNQVCKGDVECYSIDDIVKNPFSFTWRVEEGMIESQNPNQSSRICVKWDKNSPNKKGKVCVTYSDSCSSSLEACIEVEFGKSEKDIAGPDQKVGGVLGAKMNAKGTKGLWTYAGGPGSATFTDQTDPKSRVRVSRFGSYMFKWTIMEGDCEVYGFVTVNFYIEFPELEGEYYKPFYDIGGPGFGLGNVRAHYINDQLTFEGKLKTNSAIQYQIVNIQGQVLHSNELQSNDDEFVKNVTLELPAGIYFLILENNTEQKISKFMVF